MPVFLQFRLWLSQGPVRERVLAASAAAIVVVLLILVSLPLRDGGTGTDVSATGAAGDTTGAAAAGSPASQSAPGDAAAGGGGASTGASAGTAGGASAAGATAGSAHTNTGGATASGAGSGSVTAAGSGGTDTGVAAAGGACSGLTNSAPGITDKELHVDISLVNLAGPVGNAAFSIRPDTKQIADAVVDDINKNGGIACGRKLVIKKYDVNPIDANDQQSKCLQMASDKPFAVLDFAGYITSGARACFVQNKLPFQISTSAINKELTSGYPYLFGLTAPSEKQVRDGILGLNEAGFFGAPKFRKLGLLEDECEPTVNAEIDADLAKIGVTAAQISKFTLSCQLVAPPSEIVQGVLRHKAAGVTHVFLASSISNSQNYTQLAAQQDFHPVYGTSDYGTNTANVGSWDPSFAGALAVSSQHFGDLASGIRTAEVNACDKLLKNHGLTGIRNEKQDGAALNLCDGFNFFRQAIDKVGANPTRQSFIDAGVSHLGTFKAAGGSDGVFDRDRKVVGGDFHRSIQFDGGCACWKVRGDPAFKPGFQ